ncbi:MAG: hypothetical protein RLZZ126_1487 [Pseudomonadota bacterium]
MNPFCALAAAALAACAATAAHAQYKPPFDDDTWTGVQLLVDNDLFVPGKTDRWYTHGMRLSWNYDRPPKTLLARSFMTLLSDWAGLAGRDVPLTYSIGQSMYSPRDISNPAPQPQDRPWAGFSYFSISAQNESAPHFSAAEIKLGLTGPGSGAETVQTQWHRLIGSPHPAGWAQQTLARPIVQATWASVTRHPNFWRDRLAWQNGWGAAIGNARVYGNLNLSLLMGDLRHTAGDAPILIPNEGDFVAHDFRKRPVYEKPFGYLSVTANAVAYNYFIEGPVPYVNDVRALPLHATAQLGVSLPVGRWANLGRSLRATYAFNVRTSEHQTISTGQPGGVQRWGSFALVFNLD